MFRVDRVIPVMVLLAAGLSLSACGGGGNFDPTEWIPEDMFGSKPKLTGERKLVFPEGVPGVPEGVPKELVKGNQQAAMEDPAVITAEPAPVAKPARPARPQAARPPPKPRTASAPPQSAPARTAPPPQAASQSAAPWPDPNAAPPPRPARTSPSAPAWPEPNAQANWPPPNPDTFSR